ncbi:MAG TPA: 4Fe-4S binding protein [Thermotogota bacterium]|nr:4Fe-4S binding protein [Thermotogota bacterium]HPJ88431.1 4Fe-4S binding protein [Thermotogota bacterium]HPR95402.1 4Fe-4S binding protein [Thermotogota bacterium]
MDLSVKIGEQIKLENPLMPASGPLVGDSNKIKRLSGFGLGALVTKTISVQAAQVPHPCIVGGKDYIVNAELWSEYSPERWEEEFLPEISELKQPLIISLGYRQEEIVSLIKRVERFATAFELSTHYVGKDLTPIAKTVRAASEATNKPVFIKLSPHIEKAAEFAQMVKDNGGYGLVAINSVGPTFPVDLMHSRSPLGSKDGFGWISGPVIKNIALSKIKQVCEAVDIPVIGVGGISSAKDVLEFVSAGASAVQMLSSAMLYGKDLYGKILKELPREMEKIGCVSLIELRGKALRKNDTVRFDAGFPLINDEKCTRCNLCVRNCPYEALSNENNRVVVDQELCFRCGLCESRCPFGAIEGVL